jgi:hypothetical protein
MCSCDTPIYTLSHVLIYATGGTVHLVCRNAGRGEEARDTIVRETKNEVCYVE